MYTRYSVRRHREVRYIADAIERSGGTLLNDPDPTSAPFQFDVLSPQGDLLHTLCYAFYANKYRQKGRPSDEHRLQIKYGKNFQEYHEIFIDPSRSIITLLFGVHIDEGIFIALDPAMHNPTWFSRSVEFKDLQISRTQESGWFGWERDRSEARRKRVAPLEDLRTEVLLGFTPENFIRYVNFERVATALESGERLFLIEGFDSDYRASSRHPLEVEFGLPAWKILDLISDALRLKVAVRGSVAEEYLRRYLYDVPGVSNLEALDKDGMPDFSLKYRDEKTYLVECKNVLRRKANSRVRVDFQRTRASVGDPCTRYYKPTDFDILAACLFPVTGSWDFRFCATRLLAPHSKCPGRLSQTVYTDDIGWSDSVSEVLDELR